MPPHPTRSAFVRASTRSLGSIAFGSLIVAIIELIRMILNYARANAAADGNCESSYPCLCRRCINQGRSRRGMPCGMCGVFPGAHREPC